MFQQLESRVLFALTPLGGEVGVPALAEAARSVDVAVAENGSYLVVTAEADANDWSDNTVTAVRYNAAGAQLGDPIELFSFDTRGQAQVSASIDAVVAFSSLSGTDFESDPGEYAVYVVRISKEGVVSSPTQLDTLVPATGNFDVSLFSPEVSMDPQGRFFVSWIETLNRDAHDIHFRAFDAAGAPRAAEFSVTQSSPFSSIGGLDLAAKPDGSGAVFSVGFSFSDSLANEARFGQVDLDSLVGEVAVAFGAVFGPTSVAAMADGGFAVAAGRMGPGPNGGSDNTSDATAYVKRFAADGEQLGQEIQVGAALANGGKGLSAVQLDDLPEGGFLAMFVQSVRNADAQTATNTIYVSRYDVTFDAGAVLTPEGDVAINSVQSPVFSSQTDAGAWSASLSTALPSFAISAGGRRVVAAHVENGAASYQRLLLDASQLVLLENGVLYVVGTDADDAITISLSRGRIVVSRDVLGDRFDMVKSFDSSSVNVIDINAFRGHDTITNNVSRKSTLRGGDGNDHISGGAFEDRIHGGAGNDEISGGDGADRLYGEDGADSLYGNGSNDRLEGGAQSDHMRGNGGRDKLFGNGGNDRIYGGESGDWMYGQPGNDQIMGEGGNDRLYGDDGESDILHGNAGDDVFITLDAVVDQLFGDGGRDTAYRDTEDLLMSIESIL